MRSLVGLLDLLSCIFMKTHSKRSALLSPCVLNMELVLGNQLLVLKKLVFFDILVFSYKKKWDFILFELSQILGMLSITGPTGLKPITVKMNHWPEIERFYHCVLLEDCFFACSVSVCSYVECFMIIISILKA